MAIQPLAFPVCYDGKDDLDPGMTLRDYFAAAVLPSVYQDYHHTLRTGESEPADFTTETEIAERAYAVADAMLIAREN